MQIKLLLLFIFIYPYLYAYEFISNNDYILNVSTGIIWEKSVNNSELSWSDALDACSNKGTGWFLPNINELQTIMNYSNPNPKVDNIFENFTDKTLWTSTIYRADGEYAYAIHFSTGKIQYLATNITYYYICAKYK